MMSVTGVWINLPYPKNIQITWILLLLLILIINIIIISSSRLYTNTGCNISSGLVGGSLDGS